MKQENRKLIWLLLGALIFNAVFWKEKMALNTVLFGLYIIIALFCLYPKARQSNKVRWLLAGHLLCLAMVVWHNTDLSKFAYDISLVILVAFAHFEHRAIAFAGGSFLENMVFALPSFAQNLPKLNSGTQTRFRPGKYIRFALIPLLLALLFFIIYNVANKAFNDITVRFLDSIGDYLENFFEYFSLGRFFFFLFGLFITTTLIQKSRKGYFEKKEKDLSDQVLRKKTDRIKHHASMGFEILQGVLGRLVTGVMALKNFNTVAIISLVLLNILLAITNGIDISYLWIGFDTKGVNLYQLIHDGSNLLIISILLAITVVIVFFKGNLNFYSRTRSLRVLAYIWIVQNMILVVSVFIRDYYYIREAGLARNRIGILFYLALVFFGLITVCWKIYFKKSTYFLFRVNAWAAFFLLVVSTTINWDLLIVKYNLSRKDEIILPARYMTDLSPSVLPILDANRETISRHETLMGKAGFWDRQDCEGCSIKNLDDRIERYMHLQKSYSWLSWNRSDELFKQYFNTKNK